MLRNYATKQRNYFGPYHSCISNPRKKIFSEIQMLLLVRIPLAIYDVAYFYVKIHSRQDKR